MFETQFSCVVIRREISKSLLKFLGLNFFPAASASQLFGVERLITFTIFNRLANIPVGSYPRFYQNFKSLALVNRKEV